MKDEKESQRVLIDEKVLPNCRRVSVVGEKVAEWGGSREKRGQGGR